MVQNTDNENKTGYFLCEFFASIIFEWKMHATITASHLHTWYVTYMRKLSAIKKSLGRQKKKKIKVHFVDQLMIKSFNNNNNSIVCLKSWMDFSNSSYDFDGRPGPLTIVVIPRIENNIAQKLIVNTLSWRTRGKSRQNSPNRSYQLGGS